MLYNVGEHISKARDEMLDGEPFDGIKTGFRDLDDKTGGLWNKELIVLGARPSMGKTAMALSILENIAVDNAKTCVMFSLECSVDQITKRMIRRRAHIEGFSGKISKSDRGHINDAASELKDARLYIDDTPVVSVKYIRNVCKDIQRSQAVWLVVIDYLQLMAVEGENCRTQSERLNRSVRELKRLAEELDYPILVLTQLNRNAEKRSDHRPMLSDIRDASELELIADEIMFLYRDEYYDRDTELKGIAEINIAKCRHGNRGVVKLAYLPEYSLFANFER